MCNLSPRSVGVSLSLASHDSRGHDAAAVVDAVARYEMITWVFDSEVHSGSPNQPTGNHNMENFLDNCKNPTRFLSAIGEVRKCSARS